MTKALKYTSLEKEQAKRAEVVNNLADALSSIDKAKDVKFVA